MKLLACAAALLASCKTGSTARNQADAGVAPASAGSAAVKASAQPVKHRRSGYAAPEPAPVHVPPPADVAAPPQDAARTKSGLASKVLRAGSGSEHPRRYDHVRVQYTGWKRDGSMVDNREAQVAVNQLIPGWSEAVQSMVVGEKRRIWVPSKLAYGDSPAPKLPAGDLTFDVELREIISRVQPPMDIQAPPKHAKRTQSGLAYVVLTRGTGTRRPKLTDRVRVEYSGWLPNGRLFDSTSVRKRPSTLEVNSGIAGWREGVQLMRAGDKWLFWVPSRLAYGDKPQHGVPSGPLVFEITLLEIVAPED
ncbi:MAG TPA: FKBP-type peptidyl-prolyl cis-trans isomerase [Polyangiaceae bacterium]|nr:FKBP-type peptidyl-prolyl cis-trans isomerase [Polyangiaceae bacterium]